MARKPFPAKLYKYQPPTQRVIDNIRERCLWFSSPQNFNDPFDCDLQFVITGTSDENMFALYKNLRKEITDKVSFDAKYGTNGKPNQDFTRYIVDAATDATNEIKTKWPRIGVACFSELKNNILMWSHYSDKHQGFCLEFNTQFPPFRKDQKELCVDVQYLPSNSYPTISILEILDSNLPPILKSLLATKSIHWQYEQEWRVISSSLGSGGPFQGVALPFDGLALTGI